MQIMIVSAVLAGCAFWYQRLRVLQEFGWKFTDEDQSLLAFTLRELQSGSLHSPTFYGQSYGNWIESAIGALFTPASVSPSLTLPIATQLLFWLPFAGLAWKEWKAGRAIVAKALLWIPCFLPHRADLLFSLPRAWLPGISLAMLGATLLRSRPLWLGASQVCAFTLNSAAALMTLPVLVEALMRNRHDRAWIRRLIGGAALGCLHPLGTWIFDSLHPGWSIHPSPGWNWSAERTVQGLQNLDGLAGSMLPLSIALLGAAIFVGRLQAPARWAIGVLVCAMIGTLGLEKIWDGSSSVFFPHERAFVALPFAGCWFFWLSLEQSDWKPASAREAARKNTFGLVLLLGALLAKESLRTEAIEFEIARSSASVVAPRRVDELQEICQHAEARALAARVHWVVFAQDRAAAYACAAIWNGRLETIHPPYERRQWLLGRYERANSIWIGEPGRE